MPEMDGAFLAWSGDGTKVGRVLPNGHIRIWDAERGYEIAQDGSRRGELAWRITIALAHLDGEEVLCVFARLSTCTGHPRLLELRGSIYAILGEYEHASSEFAKLVGSDCQWHMKPAIDLARCELGSGNEAKFRQVCAVLASSIDEDETPSNRAHVLQRCVISPKSQVDRSVLQQMSAELNVAAQGLFIWETGASMLRQGKPEDAERLLSEAIMNVPSSPDETGTVN